MTIEAGATLGGYQLIALIGAGGMGRVFRAHDAKLGRDVAVKILPEMFATDPERLARFEQEARVLASLNHFHIAHIYGLETSPVPFIVMELVDGETLAERVVRTKRLRLPEALDLARQIADGLDAAHERGIVHRDLKPANIAVTPEGTIKILDLGLAKAGSPPGGLADLELTNSPTMLSPTLTGTLLGTAPYMSPEQARGKAVDKRADIWAFGCVVYEMLAGRPAFEGDTTTDVLARIVEREPAWDALPAEVPAAVSRLLRRCLEKDPKRRLRDIGDARLDLDAVDVDRPSPERPRRSPAFVAPLLLVGIATGAIAMWLALRSPVRDRPRPARLAFSAPEGVVLDVGPPVPSPDGTRIAFAARDREGQRTLWIRTIASLSAQRLAGTEGVAGNAVFWSPDSAWVGFAAGGKLKKISANGGPALNICSINSLLGATWSADNTILLAPANRTTLFRVAASGGTPEPLTALNAQRRENSHRWPHFLPDGRHFLFTARSDVLENNFIYVGSLDAKEIKPLIAAQSPGIYVSPGWLLYVREQTLMAQHLDLQALALTGEPVVVAAAVGHNTPSSQAFFGASNNGAVIAFEPAAPARSSLTWYNRAGESIATVGPERSYGDLQLSPDGRMAAVVVTDQNSGNRDIWLMTLANGTVSPFTSNAANDWQMTWSRDSRRLAFASDRNGRSSVYVKSIDGGPEELLLQIPERGVFPKSWSMDGHTMLLGVDTTSGIPKLWAMALDGTRKPFPVAGDEGPARENEAQISASGRWIIFESNQTGSTEVFLSPFPTGGRRQLSTAGGIGPRWGPGDREAYYLAPDGTIMVVGFGADMAASAPRPLLRPCQLTVPPASGGQHLFDVTSDGTRFLVVCAAPGSNPTQVIVAIDALPAMKSN